MRRKIAGVCALVCGGYIDMRRIAVVLAMMTIILGCSRHKGIHDEDIVAAVATQYYQFLVEGNYEAYVDVTYRATPLTTTQRQEWIDNMRMFAAQQTVTAFAVTKVTISPVIADGRSSEEASIINIDDINSDNINGDDGSREEAVNNNDDGVAPDENTSITATADVTIAITLADNTSQTILLPLVKHNNIWYLR